MSVRPYRDILRRKSRQIHVGKVAVGGDAPITVQTMTNTLTSDAAATIAQIQACEAVGWISCGYPARMRLRPGPCRRSCGR
jgi:(E)-4-hydroxy-3-methylbut-2-enyl-diphosphate synthase